MNHKSIFDRLSVSQRMSLVIVLVIALFAISMTLQNFVRIRIQDRGSEITGSLAVESQRTKIQMAVDSAASLLAASLSAIETPAERIAEIRRLTQSFRFDEDRSGYLFAVEGIHVVSHPIKPELTEKDLSQTQDPNGVYVFREIGNRAQSGGGYVEYVWEKPGMGPVPKVTYVAPIEGTPYALAAGVYLDNVAALVQETETQLDEAAGELGLFSWIGGGLLFVSILLVTYRVARSIVKPLNAISQDLDSGATSVSQATQQISSASRTLAEGASEQAAAIEESSASLEEISSTIKRNAANALEADQLMKEAKRIVAEANSGMAQLTNAMHTIQTSSQETQKIIKTIDEIAFQTNLLALNAAVEAARAGEAGAGFAVVADEVRNLAIRAAEAARNTSEMIEGSVAKIGEGTNYLDATNRSFGSVQASTEKVGTLLESIAATSSEQATGIDHIRIAVTQVDTVTQRNAGNAEESAASASELADQAQGLRRITVSLRELIQGSKGPRPADAPVKTAPPRSRAAPPPARRRAPSILVG